MSITFSQSFCLRLDFLTLSMGFNLASSLACIRSSLSESLDDRPSIFLSAGVLIMDGFLPRFVVCASISSGGVKPESSSCPLCFWISAAYLEMALCLRARRTLDAPRKNPPGIRPDLYIVFGDPYSLGRFRRAACHLRPKEAAVREHIGAGEID